MLDENEFLSPYGIRSLTHYHLGHPFVRNSVLCCYLLRAVHNPEPLSD
jgi:hypothetical protein